MAEIEWIDAAPVAKVEWEDAKPVAKTEWVDAKPIAKTEWEDAKVVPKPVTPKQKNTTWSELPETVGQVMGPLASIPITFPLSGAAGAMEFAGKSLGGGLAAALSGESISDEIGRAAQDATKTIHGIGAIPGQAFMGEPGTNPTYDFTRGKGATKAAKDTFGAVTWPFEKLSQFNRYISGADNVETPPSALRYMAGAMPEAVAYTIGGGVLAKGGVKAIQTKPLAERFARRTAVAEKAGIPEIVSAARVEKGGRTLEPVPVLQRPSNESIIITQEDNIAKATKEIKEIKVREEEDVPFKIDWETAEEMDVKALIEKEIQAEEKALTTRVEDVEKTTMIPEKVIAAAKAEEVRAADPIAQELMPTAVSKVEPPIEGKGGERVKKMNTLLPEQREAYKRAVIEAEELDVDLTMKEFDSLPFEHQYANYMRILNLVPETPPPSPEAIARAQAVAAKANAIGEARLGKTKVQQVMDNKKMYVEALIASGKYTQKQLSGMKDASITQAYNLLGKKKNDLIRLMEEDAAKLSEAERRLEALVDRERAGEIIPEEEMTAALDAWYQTEMANPDSPLSRAGGGKDPTEGVSDATYQALKERRLRIQRAVIKMKMQALELMPTSVDIKPVDTPVDKVAQRRRKGKKEETEVRGKGDVIFMKDGVEKKMSMGGVLVGDKFISVDAGSMSQDRGPGGSTFGVYDKSGREIVGGFETASEAVAHAKTLTPPPAAKVDKVAVRRRQDKPVKDRQIDLEKAIEEQERDRLEKGEGVEDDTISLEDLRREEGRGGSENEVYDWSNRMADKASIETITQLSNAASLEHQRLMDKGTWTEGDGRNAISAVYKIHPTYETRTAWMDRVIATEKRFEAEGKNHNVSQFNRDALNEALKNGDITREQRRFIENVLKTLKHQPTFDLSIDPTLKEARGTYEFMRNLLVLKSPEALVHEILHFGRDNVLTGADRIAFAQYYLDTFVTRDKTLNANREYNYTTDNINAPKNPSEMFACLGKDYAYRHIFHPTEISLFRKIFNWFERLMTDTRGELIDYAPVKALIDKIMDDNARSMWAGYAKIGADPIDVQYLRRPKTISSETIDMLGMNQMYERAKAILDNLLPSKELPGARISAELKGPNEESRIKQIQTNSRSEDSIKAWKSWVYNAPSLFKGTKVEPHWFSLNGAELKYTFHHDQNIMSIIDIYRGMSDAEVLNVRKVMEGKLQGSVSEQAAAVKSKQFFEAMKGRIRLFLKDDFRRGLNDNEYNAVMDMIGGQHPLDVAKKYPMIDIKTLKEIKANYDKVDKWGLDDYVPNYEFGRIKLMSKGENGFKLIAMGLSKRDAIRKGIKYLKENPDHRGDLFVDTSAVKMFDDRTTLNRAQYHAMERDFQKKIKETIEDVDDGFAKQLAKATLEKKFKVLPSDVYAGYLEPRRNILRGEENMRDLMHHYSYIMEKKMALDPIIDDIRQAINKGDFDRSETKAILELVEDVKGKYWWEDRTLDSIISSLNAPIKGMDWVPKILPEFDDPHGTASSYSRRARAFEANIKLGYRPNAAIINLISGQMHIYTKTGLKGWNDARTFLKTEEGQKFIKEIEPYLGTSVTEKTTGLKSTVAAWKPLGLFQKSEPFNRSMSAAAYYVKAKAEGMPEGAAFQGALRATWTQQFCYNMASLPKIMRSPGMRMVTQFMPYLTNELAFMKNLSPKEWTRYIGWNLALTGSRGAMNLLKTIPILALFPAYQEAMDQIDGYMNSNYPEWHRGVPGALELIKKGMGVDVSGPGSIQFPTSMTYGAHASTMYNIYKDFAEPWYEHGVKASTLHFRTGAEKSVPALKEWFKVVDYIRDPGGHVLDSKRNSLQKIPTFKEDPVQAGLFIIKKGLTLEGLEESKTRVANRIGERLEKKDESRRQLVLDRIAFDLLQGRPPSPDDLDLARKYEVTDPISTPINRKLINEVPAKYRMFFKKGNDMQMMLDKYKLHGGGGEYEEPLYD